jgi:protein-tyrosine phosphatase
MTSRETPGGARGRQHDADAAPSTRPDDPQRVLFVCRGNICRSPTAEAVLRARAARAGVGHRLRVASAGTGDWHVGEPPDRRAIAVAQRRGYDLTPLRARQVTRQDFQRFDWILAMDQSNLRDLSAMQPAGSQAHLGRFLDLAPHLEERDVPDPYFGGGTHFERVLDLIEHASDALLARLFGHRPAPR